MRDFISHQIAASEEITPQVNRRRATLFNRIRWNVAWFLVTVVDYNVSRRLNLGLK
jgi:cardiolipin synthase